MLPFKDDVPTRSFPVVTVTLIVANVAIFVWQLGSGFQASVFRLGMIASEVVSGVDLLPAALGPPALGLLTHQFAHGGVMHILGNMLYLWIFGNNVEDAMGKPKFLIFYLLCGVAAAGAQIAADPSAKIPMVGASGAVAGVLGAYLMLYPHARVLALVPIVIFIKLMWIPAIFFLGIWFAMQLFGVFGADSGVAFWAHIGGFLAGVLLVKPFAGELFRTGREGGFSRPQRPASLKGPWRNY